MIVFGRRLLLPLAASTAFFLVSGALYSQSLPLTNQSLHDANQSLPSAKAPLPEEPAPQFQAQSAEYLLAEAYSSSSNSGEAIDSQTPSQTPAQTPAQTQTPPDHPLTDAEKKQAAEAELQRELHQRLGGVVPNFNAVIDGSNVPLSKSQKMRASFRSAIDPYQFGLALITSGYGQATDSHSSIDPNGTHHGYPQGWGGFGERYGANYVDQFNGTIIGNGILPALLHQDARYFRMGTGSFSKRFFYSLSTTVVARSDSGKKQPNYSNVLGNLISGGISNFYYPKAERGAALTIEQGMEVTAEGSIGALLIEFYPDIRRHFSKHSQK